MRNIKSYSHKRVLLLFITAFIFLAGSIIIILFDPVQPSFYPPCFFKKITSLNCPGCVTGRALHQLLNGNVLAAMDHNILTIPFLPVIFVGLVNFFAGKLNQVWRTLNKPLLFFILITIFWVLRNLSFYPFYILNADR